MDSFPMPKKCPFFPKSKSSLKIPKTKDSPYLNPKSRIKAGFSLGSESQESLTLGPKFSRVSVRGVGYYQYADIAIFFGKDTKIGMFGVYRFSRNFPCVSVNFHNLLQLFSSVILRFHLRWVSE